MSKSWMKCAAVVSTRTPNVLVLLFFTHWWTWDRAIKAEKNNENRLEISSSDEDMMDLQKLNIAFGGLHLAKALVNCLRNHIMQYNGEFFGTNTLISMRDMNLKYFKISRMPYLSEKIAKVTFWRLGRWVHRFKRLLASKNMHGFREFLKSIFHSSQILNLRRKNYCVQ